MRIEESSGISSGKYSHSQLNLFSTGVCINRLKTRIKS